MEEVGGENRGRSSGQVQGRGRQKEVLSEAEVHHWNGGVYEEAGSTENENGRRWLGNNLRIVERVQPAVSATHARRFHGGRRNEEAAKKVMKNMMKKIRSKGRVDAENRWWVAELLAADCEKGWSSQKWHKWLEKKMTEERWIGSSLHAQEVQGVLLLPLHSNRIDCCLSLSCV